ncbi:MAG: hypothetical protein ACWGN2_11950 [Anaerolineales bacterium]
MSYSPKNEGVEEVEMQKWDIKVFYSHTGMNMSDLWGKKDKDKKSEFDFLRELASQGWEPVSATAINVGGTTSDVMFTFKRPLE